MTDPVSELVGDSDNIRMTDPVSELVGDSDNIRMTDPVSELVGDSDNIFPNVLRTCINTYKYVYLYHSYKLL